MRDVITAPIKWAQKATNWLYDKTLSPIVNKVLGDNFDNLIKGALNLPFNVVLAVGNTAFDLLEGTITGDFSLIKQGLFNGFKLFVAAFATIATLISFQWYMVPAIIIYLDANFNAGMITSSAIGVLGDFEKAVFNSEIIHRNAEYIYLAIVAASSVMTSYAAGGVIGEYMGGTWVKDVYDIYNIVGTASAIYSGVYAVTTAKERYQKEFEEWLKRFKEYEALQKQLNGVFENIHLSNDPYAYYANGSIYQSFAPTGENFNPLLVNEPYSMALRFNQRGKKEWQELNDALEYRQLNAAAGTAYYENTLDTSMKIMPFERVGTIGKNYL